MRLLHTSDWHLGRTLYSKKERVAEHNAFLKWLLNTIEENQIDILVVAGDIFDTTTPPNSAQEMYYNFLSNVKCRVVIVGGNHDSASFLDAPKQLLSALNVKVVGKASEDLTDEILLFDDAIICAVPFLRIKEVEEHYQKIAEIVKSKKKIPIIATGHLSVMGGKRTEDDGVRDIYIGNLESVSSDIFSPVFDYVALGHFHVPSVLKENIRYCGSPIKMGFGEAGQQKIVVLVDFEKKITTEIKVPEFQRLESIKGDKNFILNKLDELKKTDESIWVEAIYTGDELLPELRTLLEEQTENSKVEILKVQNMQYLDKVLTGADTEKNLEELTVYDVFDKFLEDKPWGESEKSELRELYKEVAISCA